jgi:hypothetical protein
MEKFFPAVFYDVHKHSLCIVPIQRVPRAIGSRNLNVWEIVKKKPKPPRLFSISKTFLPSPLLKEGKAEYLGNRKKAPGRGSPCPRQNVFSLYGLNNFTLVIVEFYEINLDLIKGTLLNYWLLNRSI